MVSPRYSELGRTLGIVEDELPWYWTLSVHGSPWVLMAGFVSFPFAMDHRSHIYANPSAITVTSSILLGMSYIACAVSCVRWRKSHVLQDLLLIPFFGASLLGLLNVSLNISLRELYPLDTLSIAVVSIASASTVCFGSAALYNSQIEKYIPGFMKNRPRFRDSGIDDAELQRRQLLQLYLKNDHDRAPSTDASRSTFRIDLPDGDMDGAEEMITPPQGAYERQRAAPPSNFNQNLFMVPEPPSISPPLPSQPTSNNNHSNRNSGSSGNYRPTAVRSLYPSKPARNPRRTVAELGDL